MFDHQAVGRVVDVLRGAAEVYPLIYRLESRALCESFLEEVLDGFDVMVGCRFKLFDSRRRPGIEVVGNGLDVRLVFCAQGCELLYARVLAQKKHPAHSTSTRYFMSPNSLTMGVRSLTLDRWHRHR